MKNEKKVQNIRWLSHENLNFRINNNNNNTSTLWVSISGVDLCFTLILYDFIERCNENSNIHIEIDTAWNNWRGFKVNSSEVDSLLQEIINFIVEWEIEANENGDILSEERWYAI